MSHGEGRGILIPVKCHYCSRFVHPEEVVRIGESAIQCWKCREKHTTQIEVFDPPHECQGCHRTFEQIAAATEGHRVSMFAHWKDGAYQILCARCDEKYIQSRKDLYGPTRFGWEHKLS